MCCGRHAYEGNMARIRAEWGCAVARFYVRAGSVNAVRRALGRAPGGVRVVGRYDRETIECDHTMEAHSLGRVWPILVSRLGKSGLAIVPRPGSSTGSPSPPGSADDDER
jgi:hypothetical protein